MLANAKPSIDALPPDRPRREIIALCAKHGIACGTADSMVSFMRSLNENKHLAMDFWSLVARVSDACAADPDRLLADIVEGLTGQSVADVQATGPAQRLLVKRLASLMAGEDVQDLTPRKPVHTVPDSRTAPSFNQEAKKNDAADLHSPEPVADPIPEPAQESVPRRTGTSRLVLIPETPLATATDIHRREQDQQDEPAIAIPLAGYAEESSTRHISAGLAAAGVALLVLVAAGVWFVSHVNASQWSRFEISLRDGYVSLASAWQERFDHHPASPAVSGSSSASTLTPATTPEPAPTPLNQVHLPPASVQNAPTHSLGLANQPAPPLESPRIETSIAPPEPTVEAQIAVPEQVMKERLISSRVPIYPPGSDDLGPVIIQAVITAQGTVEPLRVVRGDPTLRGAAMDAVSSWQYRPYLVNGVPVNVSTTISVDSSGND